MTTITASSTIGIYLSSPSFINPIAINPGVTISSGANGVYGFTGAWTIANNGTIAAPLFSGVYLGAGGSVTNAASASIGGFDGVDIAGGVGTVVNSGNIAGSSITGIGVILSAGGSVTNQGGGTISGDTGVDLTAGGTVINASSASIAGVYEAVDISGGAGRVVNSGYIAGTGIGGIGILLGSGGTITNEASASITGQQFGVDLSAGGTLTNAGTVVGNSGTAVVFGSTGSNLLVLDPGYALSGIAIGGTSAINTLDLASAASAGMLSGLGTEFVDFAQVAIASGATWQLAGANTLAAGATISNSGTLILSGATLTGDATLNNIGGGVTIDPGTMAIGNLLGSGSVAIDAASTLDVQGTVASGETIAFGGTGAYLHLYNPGEVGGSVTNFAVGETIDLTGVDPASVGYASGQLTFTGGTILLELANGGTVQAAPSADGAEITVLCFCTNTQILTPVGERLVQDLAVGDLVTTRSGKTRPIVWIGIGKVLATRGRRNAATPVIVRKGALADNVPHHDLRVTKGHSFFIDGVLVPVEFLVNHRTILWDDRAQEVEIFHIELETHDVLLANGAPAESYRDDGNRWLFRNNNSGWDQPAKPPCARVLTGGPIVDAVWRRLLGRAGRREALPITRNPDLHLLVDGHRVDAEQTLGLARIFPLPNAPKSVRIVSRAAAPAELGLARDSRCLGIALRRLVLRQGPRFQTIEAWRVELAEGFHPYEEDNQYRWTDGDAALPAAFLESFAGPSELVLHIGDTAHYIEDGTARQAASVTGVPVRHFQPSRFCCEVWALALPRLSKPFRQEDLAQALTLAVPQVDTGGRVVPLRAI